MDPHAASSVSLFLLGDFCAGRRSELGEELAKEVSLDLSEGISGDGAAGEDCACFSCMELSGVVAVDGGMGSGAADGQGFASMRFVAQLL